MRYLLVLFVRAYQAVLSPILPAACRYHPTCSNYAHEAFEVHGTARGGWLTFTRLLRCRPLGPSGFDPVPDPTPNVHNLTEGDIR